MKRFAPVVLAAMALVALADDPKPTTLVYRLDGADGKPASAADVKTAVDVLVKRFSASGWKSIDIAPSATAGQLTVVVPPAGPTLAAQKAEEAIALVERSGTLEFRLEAAPDVERRERERLQSEGAAYVCDAGHAWVEWRGSEDRRRPPMLVEIPEGPARAQVEKLKRDGVAATAPELVDARKVFDEVVRGDVFTGADLASTSVQTFRGEKIVVSFELKPDRKDAFAEFTGKNVERNLAIILDGKLASAPVVKSRLPGVGMISGGGMKGFTEQEAREVVAVLQSGVIPGRLVLVSRETK